MIDREVMEVTLKPDLQKLCRSNLLMVNYRPHKFGETNSQGQQVPAVNLIQVLNYTVIMSSVSLTQKQ